MKNKYIQGGMVLGAALTCATAMADTAGLTPIQNPAVYTFSAFGTIGVVQTNTNNGTYTTGFEHYGATKTADFGPDSKVGAQLDAKFSQDFSATVQVLSKQNATGSYSPDVEWAFGKVKVTNGLDLRLGRIGGPFFMTSDFRNVGYTNLSVRSPVEVYQLVPVRAFNGGDLLYKTEFGETALNAQLWLGKASVAIGQNSSGDESIVLNNIAGLNVSAENGPLTVRLGTMKTRLGTDGSGISQFNGLLSGLHTLAQVPGLESLGPVANDLSVNGKFASFSGVGAVLDEGSWVLNTEYVKRTTGSTYVPTATAWYATLGYRISTFTPYVSFASRKTSSATSAAVPTVSPLVPPPYNVAYQTGAVGAAYAVDGAIGKTDQSSTAFGVRWDAGKNYDVKAEFQQIRVPANSSGSFNGIQGADYPGTTTPQNVYPVDTKVNVVSLAVDFVF